MDTPPEVMMTSARLIPSCRADSKSSGLQTQAGRIKLATPRALFTNLKTLLLVSNNSKVDGGISMFLDGGQQCWPVRISNLSWVKVILWIQELHVHKQELFFFLKNTLKVLEFHSARMCKYWSSFKSHGQSKHINKDNVWVDCVCTSFPVDMTATTGNLWTLTSVMPTVASSPISDGPICVPLANTHSPRLMSWPIGLCSQRRDNLVSGPVKQFDKWIKTAVNINDCNNHLRDYIIVWFLTKMNTE